MSSATVVTARAARSSKTRVALFSLGIVLLFAQPGQAQDSLKFFKNYFVTGDYVVAGVSLRGTGGGGVIDLTDANVPENADILAAFLYWQTILKVQDGVDAGTTGATFRGQSLSATKNGTSYSIAKVLNPAGTAPCWSSGGSTGSANGTHQMFTYRADVLRFFDQDPSTGKLEVNTTHNVTLPDAGGNPSQSPSTSGASLVVIYRDPTKPLNAIVVYDGGFTMDNSTSTMIQTIGGFYQPAASPVAKMTHIVGDGQPNFSEQVLFKDQLVANGTNPFVNGWENPTFAIDPAVLGTATPATVKVAPVGTPFDCLSWGAIIFSTTVQDTDEDGLLDIWESSSTALSDPNGGFLPDLKAMGADPNVQDIFVEVGFMATAGYENFAQEVLAHSHLPPKSVFDTVATAFRNAAPRKRLSGGSISGPINIHFDVGGNYQGGLPTLAQCQANWQASCAIVPQSAGASGGDEIPETAGCVTDGSGNTTCGGTFPNYPGTVGWKSGFQLLKNQPLYKVTSAGPVPFGLGASLPSLEEQCVIAGAACVRRSDRSRKDIFRYALFAHALGLVRVNVDGDPVLDPTGAKIPKNTSGIADGGGVGGADLMVTLGFWGGDQYNGTNFMQASTLMHELGHTFGLRHGGGPPVQLSGSFVAQPNCKPNVLSIMNYLFQVRGLVNTQGVLSIDYSRQVLGPTVTSGQVDPLNEGSLSEANGLRTINLNEPMAYRTSWYVPLANVSNVSALVSRHCDGTFFTSGQPLVRVDGTSVTGSINWNSNSGTTPVQDINFNGDINNGTGDELKFVGFNDFEQVDLRQVGGRRNAGAERIGGGLSLDVGFGDVGFGDVGFGDVGFGDVGFGDVGFGDVGFGDVGFGDVGFGDVGFGDVGFGDVGFGDVGAPPGDLDLDTAGDLNAPNSLTATSQQKAIHLQWAPPHLGVVVGYNVYRVVGGSITPISVIERLGTLLPTTSMTMFDDFDVKNNVTYTYFVVAELNDGAGGLDDGPTGPSNFVTIRK